MERSLLLEPRAEDGGTARLKRQSNRTSSALTTRILSKPSSDRAMSRSVASSPSLSHLNPGSPAPGPLLKRAESYEPGVPSPNMRLSKSFGESDYPAKAEGKADAKPDAKPDNKSPREHSGSSPLARKASSSALTKPPVEGDSFKSMRGNSQILRTLGTASPIMGKRSRSGSVADVTISPGRTSREPSEDSDSEEIVLKDGM